MTGKLKRPRDRLLPSFELPQLDGPTWSNELELKVFGYIDLTRAYLTRMTRRKRGVIISVIGAAAGRGGW
jgi:3-oxoacyl-[acyl-carrier protein] reductase